MPEDPPTQAPAGLPYPPPPVAEPMWPAQLTVLGAIALQLLLPARLTAGPSWLVPSLEGALLIGLAAASPRQLQRPHSRRKIAATVLTALVSAANIYSLAALTHYLLHHNVSNGRELIVSGVLIWLTNVLIFSLWYWEMDRGGPGKRAVGRADEPDFLFTQMGDAMPYVPQDWTPRFIDYLYLSFTSATAFSPTDVLPLSPIAKSLMGIQGLVSLVTIGLIVSRAVNILS